MRTTGIFTTQYFRYNFNKINKPMYLFPFGDIHAGSYMHDKQRWHRYLEWAKGKKDALFIGMGDYFDLGSTSERRLLNSPDLHESTGSTLDDLYMDGVLRMTKELSFMRGRLIGLIEGNHYGVFTRTGITTTQKMCDILGCKYLGVASLIKLHIISTRNANYSLDIFAHHGKGSGLLVGSGLNNVQKMADIAIADIYLMGDNHQKVLGYSDKLYLSRDSGHKVMRVKQKKQLFARTGSFLKGYEDNKASYVTDKLLNPTNLGTIKIEITPKRVQVNENGKTYEENYLDLHASL